MHSHIKMENLKAFFEKTFSEYMIILHVYKIQWRMCIGKEVQAHGQTFSGCFFQYITDSVINR